MSTGWTVADPPFSDPAPQPVSSLLGTPGIDGEIMKLRQDPAHLDASHPAHQAAVDRVMQAYARRCPKSDADTLAPGLGIQVDKPAESPPDDLDSAPDADDEALGDPRQSWGADFQRNVDAARGVVTHMASRLGPDVVEVFDHIGSHPVVVEALYDWGWGKPGPTHTKAQAQEIITLLRRSAVYQRGDSEARNQLLDALRALYEVGYREEPTRS